MRDPNGFLVVLDRRRKTAYAYVADKTDLTQSIHGPIAGHTCNGVLRIRAARPKKNIRPCFSTPVSDSFWLRIRTAR